MTSDYNMSRKGIEFINVVGTGLKSLNNDEIQPGPALTAAMVIIVVYN